MAQDEARARAVERIKQKRTFQQTAAGFVAVWVLLIVIWAVTGGGFFWPIFPILGMGIALALQGFQAYRSMDISEGDIEREVQREGGAQ
jgi:hypothetical protein